MFRLTGHPLFVLTVLGALIALAGAVAVAVLRNDKPLRRRLLSRAVPVTALVVVAQFFAMAALALHVNDTYDFYTSWADLTGHVSQGAGIQAGGVVSAGQGTIKVMTVHSQHTGNQDQVMVWLPPQYQQPAYAHTKFPVVMFLSGQPSTPEIAFNQFNFGQTASQEISAHRVPPFIAVFPTLEVSPPRDTECTNVPGGPRALDWLSTDVPAFIGQNFRTDPLGKDWTTMGWSTGGFCSAKLVATYPKRFGSAASFGGYYQPLQDHTTGSLFGGRRRLRIYNSPQWLYLHIGGLRGSRLLLISGTQDHETWKSTQQMLTATAGDPNVQHISFPQGGHNYHNYAAYLPSALRWGAASWTGGSTGTVS